MFEESSVGEYVLANLVSLFLTFTASIEESTATSNIMSQTVSPFLGNE